MQFSEWEPIYKQILADFGWPREADEKAAQILSKIVEGHEFALEKLGKLLQGKSVLVVGPASPKFGGSFDAIICAGSSASAMRAAKVMPTILVTDLDGNVEDQIFLNRMGAIAAIHAHGDNMNALRRWVPQFPGVIVATTQATPLQNVHNFGGFTDGDRAVCIAAHFGTKSISVTGFDFEHPIGFSKNIEIKMKKLQWAKRILEKFEVTFV
ncbi:MAG: DUF115 domain-containing protein [Candidatus Thermoplasmatota archaeon]|nr:DUF115 domain-containing protein [Candidatus Thermoplasmatota archaeon]